MIVAKMLKRGVGVMVVMALVSGACGDNLAGPTVSEVCGDGIRSASEACDDGDVVAGDGCSATCELETCGEGTAVTESSVENLVLPDGEVESIVIADLDGDGANDLVTVSSDLVKAHFNAREHVFGTTTIGWADRGESAAVLDVERDGDLDLVVCDALSGLQAYEQVAPRQFVLRSSSPFVGCKQVVAGDLDGDGAQDLVTGSDSGSVRVHWSSGDFYWETQVVATGAKPKSVALADVDRDGDLDLATGDAGSSHVEIVQNGGGRMFASLQVVQVGGEPEALVAADLDLDGDVDLVAACAGSSGVAVLDNRGGTFVATSLPVGMRPWGVEVADLDGDGLPDIVTADRGQRALGFLRNLRSLSFDSARYAAMLGAPVAVSAGALDGDCLPDLVVGQRDGLATAYFTQQLCGNGVIQGIELCDDGNVIDADGCDSNCTLTSCGNLVVTTGEQCDDGNLVDGDGCDSNCTVTACGNGIVASGEQCDDGDLFDGDGCDSNCTATACGNQVVTTGEQCDDGNTTNDDGCDADCTATGCGNAIRTTGEACDDGNLVDGDGCNADCLPSTCHDHARNAGEMCVTGQAIITSVAGGIGPMIAADVDGDGDLDLIGASTASGMEGIAVLLDDGTGHLSAPVFTKISDIPRGLAAGDFDGDGDLDFVIPTSYGGLAKVVLFQNDGAGGFVASTVFQNSTNGFYGIAAGDLDGDIDVDIAVTGFTSMVLLNDGTGAIGSVQTPADGFGGDLLLGDVDGDGDLDIVSRGFNVLVTDLNSGAGAFAHSTTTGDLQGALAMGDIDGDTDADVVTSGLTFTNNGSGQFTSSGGLGDNGAIALVDLDGDGALDLVRGFQTTPPALAVLTVLRGTGTGEFTPWSTLRASCDQLLAADLDGDAAADLVCGNSTGGTISVFLSVP